jgi:integrase/recombinase XerD
MNEGLAIFPNNCCVRGDRDRGAYTDALDVFPKLAVARTSPNRLLVAMSFLWCDDTGGPRLREKATDYSIIRATFPRVSIRPSRRISYPGNGLVAREGSGMGHEQIGRFLFSLEAMGRTPGTIARHRTHLGRLEAWLHGQECPDLSAASREDLTGFVAHLRNRVQAGSANNYVGSLRFFFRWLTEEGIRLDNPATRLRFLPCAEQPIRSITPSAVRALRAEAVRLRHGRLRHYRTAVLALLLADTGMRIGEALALRLEDVDLGEGRILVHASKTRTVRMVPISRLMQRHLRWYLRRGAPSSWLFPGWHGHLSQSVARHAFGRLMSRLGIRCTPHWLRHTYITLSLINRAPTRVVQLVTGIKQLSTLERYARMTDGQVKAVHDATSPLGRSKR